MKLSYVIYIVYILFEKKITPKANELMFTVSYVVTVN